MIRPLQSARMRRGGFLSPVRGLWYFTSFTHGLRPFDRLRTGCGLRSVAASRLGPLPRGQEGRASTQYLTSFCGRMRRMSGWDAGALRWSFLSPLRGWLLFVVSIPTACAVGCILSPLRGWRHFRGDISHRQVQDSLKGISRPASDGLRGLALTAGWECEGNGSFGFNVGCDLRFRRFK